MLRIPLGLLFFVFFNLGILEVLGCKPTIPNTTTTRGTTRTTMITRTTAKRTTTTTTTEPPENTLEFKKEFYMDVLPTVKWSFPTTGQKSPPFQSANPMTAREAIENDIQEEVDRILAPKRVRAFLRVAAPITLTTKIDKNFQGIQADVVEGNNGKCNPTTKNNVVLAENNYTIAFTCSQGTRNLFPFPPVLIQGNFSMENPDDMDEDDWRSLAADLQRGLIDNHFVEFPENGRIVIEGIEMDKATGTTDMLEEKATGTTEMTENTSVSSKDLESTEITQEEKLSTSTLTSDSTDSETPWSASAKEGITMDSSSSSSSTLTETTHSIPSNGTDSTETTVDLRLRAKAKYWMMVLPPGTWSYPSKAVNFVKNSQKWNKTEANEEIRRSIQRAVDVVFMKNGKKAIVEVDDETEIIADIVSIDEEDEGLCSTVVSYYTVLLDRNGTISESCDVNTRRRESYGGALVKGRILMEKKEAETVWDELRCSLKRQLESTERVRFIKELNLTEIVDETETTSSTTATPFSSETSTSSQMEDAGSTMTLATVFASSSETTRSSEDDASTVRLTTEASPSATGNDQETTETPSTESSSSSSDSDNQRHFRMLVYPPAIWSFPTDEKNFRENLQKWNKTEAKEEIRQCIQRAVDFLLLQNEEKNGSVVVEINENVEIRADIDEIAEDGSCAHIGSNSTVILDSETKTIRSLCDINTGRPIPYPGATVSGTLSSEDSDAWDLLRKNMTRELKKQNVQFFNEEDFLLSL